MANHPSVLLCDQRTSTSALDPHSSQEILDFLLKVNRELGVTVVIVTHQMSIVNEICNKVGVMEAGRLVETFAQRPCGAGPRAKGEHLPVQG